MHEYQPLARFYLRALVGHKFHENIMASAKSAWRRAVQITEKKRSRLVMRQCSTSISAVGTCCSRILDREQFAIIWVFVAFLMLPSRVTTHQSETRNQHVFLFLLLLLQTVGLQITGFTILHALFQDCSPVYEMRLFCCVYPDQVTSAIHGYFI